MIVQMSAVKCFSPNRNTHPEFTDAFTKAEKLGVKILSFECKITPDSINITKEMKTKLQ